MAAEATSRDWIRQFTPEQRHAVAEYLSGNGCFWQTADAAKAELFSEKQRPQTVSPQGIFYYMTLKKAPITPDVAECAVRVLMHIGLPASIEYGQHTKTPLDVAIDHGHHATVYALLKLSSKFPQHVNVDDALFRAIENQSIECFDGFVQYASQSALNGASLGLRAPLIALAKMAREWDTRVKNKEVSRPLDMFRVLMRRAHEDGSGLCPTDPVSLPYDDVSERPVAYIERHLKTAATGLESEHMLTTMKRDLEHAIERQTIYHNRVLPTILLSELHGILPDTVTRICAIYLRYS
jgi:hypothetical protein